MSTFIAVVITLLIVAVPLSFFAGMITGAIVEERNREKEQAEWNAKYNK